MGKMTSGLEKAATEGFKTTVTQGRLASQKIASQKIASQKIASWHPVPILLVDEVMPRLKDTELRVLLVVLRQTWGWKADRSAPDNPPSRDKQPRDRQFSNKQFTKRRDWLSHRQLCRRTGRGGDAVSSAVASLTASGLIIVEDAAGCPLPTPEERRRCLGRLYFRPGDMWTSEKSEQREKRAT